MWLFKLFHLKQVKLFAKPQTATSLPKCLAFLFCLALFGFPSFAQAYSGYVADWDALYDLSASEQNSTPCKLCHTADSAGAFWNAYGWAIKEDSGATPAARIKNVENLNSDGDPSNSSNLDEIDANTQPGWTDGAFNSTYDANGLISSTATAPAGFSGNLDISTYTIGGTITGLTGSVTLQNNGTDSLVRSTNGVFTFAAALTQGSNYAVTVLSQPEGQTCSVTSGSGTDVQANVTTVAVNCVNNPAVTYTIGGTITGLTGSVTLQNNGGDSLVRSDNGVFTFATALPGDSDYVVTVFIQPEGQTCSITNGSGVIAEGNVTDVAVTCVDDPDPTYTIGGSISGLSGDVTLQNNGDDNLVRSANGIFTFAIALDDKSNYTVTVLTQPTGQICTVTAGSGAVAAANITDVLVTCVSLFGVAHVEWEALPFMAEILQPVPFIGNAGLLLIGLVLLLIGVHHIRRQQSAMLRLLALFAISSGVLISTQGSYQFIEMARAATSILLTVSPEPLVLGDNSVKNGQAQRIVITALPSNTCVIDQSMADASPCSVGTILYPEESCQVYVSCDINTPKDPSPDGFLQFPNPPNWDQEIAAIEYYQAIDPNGDRDTLEKWKLETGFAAGFDAEATYVNDTDLGFGRKMYVRKNVGDGSVASYVENYPNIQDAMDGTNLIATVAMEYSSPTGVEPKFTQFYTFGPNGDQLLAVDLDGRGERFQPDVCLVCHGGTPKATYAGPADADVGAGFLPWDLDTFVYAPVPEKYSRAAQEGEFKKLNLAALDTNPTTAAKSMVEGWYGGAGLPGDFNGEFVPDVWWTLAKDAGGDAVANTEDAKALYQDVVAPYCRACHVMRSPDFSSHEMFDQNKASTKNHVFDQGTMPLALRTFEKFWHSPDDVNVLAGFVGVALDPDPPTP